MGKRSWWAFGVLLLFAHSDMLSTCQGKPSSASIPRPDADVLSEHNAEKRFGTASDQVFIPLSSDSSADGTRSSAQQSWSWDTYHSHDVMVSFLENLAQQSNGTCFLKYLTPASVLGRQLVVMVVGTDEGRSNSSVLPKPVFTWIGNMHGDETANRELLLRLAAGLCSGQLAAEDPRWRAMQAATVVHIIPSMNPDGFALLQRYNARGVDLNRNFWTAAFPYAKPPKSVALAKDTWGNYLHWVAATWSQVGNFSLQPEALAVSSWLVSNPPDLSANLHGGALVANYPMDACDSLGDVTNCPSTEDPVPQLMAAGYAASNPAMFASQEDLSFANGTVQGAVWYPVLGSMQDWVYHALKRLMLTLELHDIKNPPAANLTDLWQENQGAMLRLMELSRMGLRARVLDAATRTPLSANVTVTKPAGVRGATASAAQGGYFFKPLAPGLQYTLTVKPYNPADKSVSYAALTVKVRLGVSRGAVAGGQGLEGLAAERVLLATRAGSSAKVKRRSL